MGHHTPALGSVLDLPEKVSQPVARTLAYSLGNLCLRIGLPGFLDNAKALISRKEFDDRVSAQYGQKYIALE